MSDRLPKIKKFPDYEDDDLEIWEMTVEEAWAYDQWAEREYRRMEREKNIFSKGCKNEPDHL